MQDNKRVDLFLASINQHIENNIVDNTERKLNNKDFISWGNNNDYPQFLLKLYNECATLQSVINATSDYVIGDDIVCNAEYFGKKVNNKGETIRDLIQKIAIDYLIFGSFALQIIRNFAGNVAEIYWVDITKLRSDEKNEIFYYSEDWSKSYGRVKTLQYPKFNPNDENATSIFYFKGNKSRSTYSVPMWGASAKNALIDIAISDFHLNEINNNFMSSKLISFNNGLPDDLMKAEIEQNLNEKFSGSENAGRIMISFAQSRENAPEILNLASDDFDSRYESLERRNKEQIFIAFRATPLLFGLYSESNGFSTSEYKDSYKIFNKTVVTPIQQDIIKSFDKILGITNSITITPFTIKFEEDEKI